MNTNTTKTTKSVKSASKKIVAAPAIPALDGVTEMLDVTNPARKLTRDEWRGLSIEQKRARKDAKRASRPEMKARLAKNMERFARRVSKVLGMMDVDSVDSEVQETIQALTSAKRNLLHASEAIRELPQDWTPATPRAAGAAAKAKAPRISEGDMVMIAEKRRASYEGLLSSEDMTSLRVLKIHGKRAVVTCSLGQMFMPMNILVIAD